MPQKLPARPRHDVLRKRVFGTRLGRFDVRRLPVELLGLEGPQDVNGRDGERDLVDAEHGRVREQSDILFAATSVAGVSVRAALLQTEPQDGAKSCARPHLAETEFRILDERRLRERYMRVHEIPTVRDEQYGRPWTRRYEGGEFAGYPAAEQGRRQFVDLAAHDERMSRVDERSGLRGVRMRCQTPGRLYHRCFALRGRANATSPRSARPVSPAWPIRPAPRGVRTRGRSRACTVPPRRGRSSDSRQAVSVRCRTASRGGKTVPCRWRRWAASVPVSSSRVSSA